MYLKVKKDYLQALISINYRHIHLIKITSVDGVVIPEIKIDLATEHPYFNFHLGFGTNKKLKKSDSSLITMPFSFLHKNANCVHNGIMLAVFDGKNISNA